MIRWSFRAAIVCLACYWLLICTLTHLPAGDLPHVKVNDKIEHFAAFALLGFLLNTVLRQFSRRHADWLTLAIILIYGALDEWLQPLTGRSCDFQDWLADGAGAAAGVVVCNLARVALSWMAGEREHARENADGEQRGRPGKSRSDDRSASG